MALIVQGNRSINLIERRGRDGGEKFWDLNLPPELLDGIAPDETTDAITFTVNDPVLFDVVVDD